MYLVNSKEDATASAALRRKRTAGNAMWAYLCSPSLSVSVGPLAEERCAVSKTPLILTRAHCITPVT